MHYYAHTIISWGLQGVVGVGVSWLADHLRRRSRDLAKISAPVKPVRAAKLPDTKPLAIVE